VNIVIYYYRVAFDGEATLYKGDEYPLVKIGKYKTEVQAVEACQAHYEKACQALQNLGKPIPQMFFM
jgi:hypothetical protein